MPATRGVIYRRFQVGAAKGKSATALPTEPFPFLEYERRALESELIALWIDLEEGANDSLYSRAFYRAK
jgi:hypothetical protein